MSACAADYLGAAGPTVDSLAFIFLAGGIVAASADDIPTHFALLFTAAFLLPASGFGSAYLVARIFRFDKIIARTVSIEVGMQNS